MNVGDTAFAFAIALIAGAGGAALGIGGGIFIIPSLTLFLHAGMKTAIATSIVGVVATSVSGGIVFLRQQDANMRLGLLLALATTPGAVVGAVVGGHIASRFLSGIFALVLLASAIEMVRNSSSGLENEPAPEQSKARARGTGTSSDARTGASSTHRITHMPLGLAISAGAGLVSGLLGVGGGIVQVPLMHVLMRVPFKVATATSTYIIGMTAMAGGIVYYVQRPSLVDPVLVVPVTAGVVIGAAMGTRILRHVSRTVLRTTFIIVVVVYAIQMVLRTFGGAGG
ncbi:MAG: sulfite exporter TauE/SafE family protein [Chloroflexota bacterium]